LSKPATTTPAIDILNYKKYNLTEVKNMNIILWTMALTVAIILTIVKREFNGLSAFIIISAVVCLIFSVLNAITSEKTIKPSETTLNQISQINWSDEENLLKIGFEDIKNGYTYFDPNYRIHITKTDEIPEKISEYKNYKYKFSEIGLGWFELSRLWTKEPFVERRWIIYVDNIEIYIVEDNTEGSPYIFEEVIAKFYEKQQSLK
jgi:hypothetical protein